jgi:hypothetical protein
LREQLNDSENGDFNAIMNVCATLKQDDPELFELCLKYPTQFTDSERMHSLNSQGCDLGEEVDYCDIDEMIENGECVEIHTSNVEEPIIYHNMDESDESDNINRFYMISGDDDEEPTYYEIISKDRKKKEKLDAPSAKNRPNMKIHQNDEIKLSWKITDSVMNGKFGSAVIDCCVEKLDNFEKWKIKSEKLIEFLNKNGKSPSQYSKNQDEKNLFSWTKRQKNSYNPKGPEFSKERMNNPEIWQFWTDIILDEKYSKFFSNQFENWKCTIYNKVLFFIDKNGRNPSQHSKDPSENKLGQFIKTHKKYYDPKGAEYSKFIMNNPEIWQIWTDIILDEKYSKFFSNRFENWKYMMYNKVLFFIDKNGRNPLKHSKDPYEKKLVEWIKTHKKYYDPKGAEYSKFIMNNPEIWQIWTDIILDEKYSKFFSKSSHLPRKRKISTEVQKFQSKLKFPKKDSIMSEEDKSEGSQSESEDSFQSSSLPQKRRFQ